MIVFDPVYWAGIADSDGCFTVDKQNKSDQQVPHYRSSFFLTWANTDKSLAAMNILVREFDALVCAVGSTKKHQYVKGKPYLKLALHANKAKKFTEAVLPHLLLKQEQAKVILEVLSYKGTVRIGKNGRPKWLTDKYEELYRKNKALNKANAPERIDNAAGR